ncbi:MAG TPA: hypothetical protein ENI87_02485 [bacterium]|nr:hypothetical protein [bacterium]
MTVRETVNASKERYGRDALDELFADASKVVVARGKKVLTFAPKKDTFDPDEFAKVALGPSGNLRAPTIRVGKTWYVGFSEEAYAEKFGSR